MVLDDDEAKYHTYSYKKWFGLTDLSQTDRAHIEAGRESTLDRTGRLLYVGCSRATNSLAVVLFTDDPVSAKEVLVDAGIFPPDDIHLIPVIENAPNEDPALETFLE